MAFLVALGFGYGAHRIGVAAGQIVCLSCMDTDMHFIHEGKPLLATRLGLGAHFHPA
jgi:RNase H-fold protein (predicted Holliday junction resolvase)